MPELNLGPFSLEAPIGRGAMAEVWKGHHRERGVPVAVKVMTGSRTRFDHRVKSLFNEIRSVAQLDHPGIAWVLDYGIVPLEIQERTNGHILADSPYLVMEFASRGSLHQVQQAFNWTELRAVLLALLDALAHAHARGVIHRDLKPGNILLCSRRDSRPGLKICDFGIARSQDQQLDETTVAGTLHYIAPEQLEARQREQGPWTDLYALGCVAWKLLTGEPPFAGKKQTQLMFAQLREPPPELLTATPLPDGFEPWLRTLLQKNHLDRFRCAADAAKALMDLGHPDEIPLDEEMMTGIMRPVVLSKGLPPEDPETVRMAPGDTAELAAEPMTLWLDEPTLGRAPAPRGLPEVRAVLPLDWRRPVPRRPALDLVGAGLKLFGLRQPPMVGRESERTALWDAITRVTHSQRAHAFVLQGQAGTGKTRLADWLCKRATEVGAATVLTARFSGDDDADAPLRTMLLRRFQALGLEAERLTDRLNLALDDLGITNAEMRQHAHTLLSGDKLQGASRYVLIRLLLEALAADRPVILMLDDAHAGIDALRFARHLMNAQAVRPFPVLVLLTGRTEGFETGETHTEMAALRRDPRLTELEVENLPREPFLELVQNLLGLEPALANQVVDRTTGNPLFAIQLIGDWVERDQLDLRSGGFGLKTGVSSQLPPSLKYVWVKRLNRVLEGFDKDEEQMLEGAAVLGMDVDEIQWAGMCDDPEGVHQRDGQIVVQPDSARRRHAVISRLLEMNLAEETEKGFAFRHGQFRDAVLDRARAYERLGALHRAAACQFGTRIVDTELERYGRHLLAAGQLEAALVPLLKAVPAVQGTVGRGSAWRLLDTIEDTLKTLDLDRSDQRWGQLYIERALLADMLGQHVHSVKWATKAGQEASRHGWKQIAAAANFRLARAAMRKGDLDMAQARLLRVTNQADPKLDPFLVGEALFLLGRIAKAAGDPPEEVERTMRAGRTWMLKEQDGRKRARALVHLARAALEDGQPAICTALTERARKIAIEVGDLPQQVMCLAFAAEVSRSAGDLPAAAAQIRNAIEVFELIGDAQLALLRCNLAIILLDQGQHADAIRELDRALANAVEVDRQPLRLAVHTVRLRAFAETGQDADLEEALRGCEDLLGSVRVGEKDSAACARRAYELLAARGDQRQAERAKRIAAHQYERLGDDLALETL